MVTKAWSATKATGAISKSKEAATLLLMKNKSKPKSATMASGSYGLTLSTTPKRWLTSTRRPGRSRTSLVLQQELDVVMKQTQLEWEWKEVIRGLDALQQVEANFQGRRFLFRSQLTADASQAVRATGVAIPPTLREL